MFEIEIKMNIFAYLATLPHKANKTQLWQECRHTLLQSHLPHGKQVARYSCSKNAEDEYDVAVAHLITVSQVGKQDTVVVRMLRKYRVED